MKLLITTILLFLPTVFVGQTIKKTNCEPEISTNDLHNIIRRVISLRNIDTTSILIPQLDSLEFSSKDVTILKRFIKVDKPKEFTDWAELDSSDITYMLYIRKKYKKLEWNSEVLGFKNPSTKAALSFTFPYVSQNGKTIIVGYNYYGWYDKENAYIADGGYLIVLLKNGDTWSAKELYRSLR